MGKQKNVHQEWILVRKHLTRGFPCAVLDLSGTLWPLLIPEYSGIKRRGTPFPGLRNPGISHYGEKYPLPFYEPYGKRWLFATLSLIGRDHLIICKSGILILIFADNNYSIYAHAMLIKTPLLHQSFGPRIFLSFYSFCLSLSISLFLADSLGRRSWLCNPGNINLFPSFTLSSSTPDHQVPVH